MLKCVLWDFGDTLADERWMLVGPDSLQNWSHVWSEIVKGELAESWELGQIGLRDVAHEVASQLSISVEEAINHAQSCCSRIRFFECPMEVAQRSTLPQAIVTVNPDIFTECVVPNYNLNEVFAPIVTSWQEGTVDKGDLGLAALKRIGGKIEPQETLLIDNKRRNLDSWQSKGGQVYLYTNEAQFERDLSSELLELAASASVNAPNKVST